MKRINLTQKSVDKRLGEILIELGIINDKHLDKALTVQKSSPKHTLSGSALIELGFVTEEEVIQAVNIQYRFPYLPVENYDIDPEVISLIPGDIARKYNLIPIYMMSNILTIAMSNPLNIQAIKEVEDICQCTVQTFISTSSEIKKAIDEHYNGSYKSSMLREYESVLNFK